MKILIVEDSSISRNLLRRMLELETKHQIVEAEDGLMAWNLLQRETRPDLCILDIMMPQMNGLELLRRIRGDSRLKGIKVILCSLVNNRQVVTQAAELGIQGYLLKPFQKKTIVELVKKVEQEIVTVAIDPPEVTADRLGVAVEAYFILLGRLIKETGQTIDRIRNWSGTLVPKPAAPPAANATPGEKGETAKEAEPSGGDPGTSAVSEGAGPEKVTAVTETSATPNEQPGTAAKPGGATAAPAAESAPTVGAAASEAEVVLTSLKGAAINLGAKNLLGPINRLEVVIVPAERLTPELEQMAATLQGAPHEIVKDALNDLGAENQRLSELMHILQSRNM